MQLTASQELNARYEAEIELHKLVIAECERLKEELEEAQREKDRLSGTSGVVISFVFSSVLCSIPPSVSQ